MMRKNNLWKDLRAAIFNGNGIARQLTIGVILFSSIFTLVFTTIQLYSEYINDVSSIEKNFSLIKNAQLGLVREVVWTHDEKQVKLLLDGITQYPNISYAGISVDGNIKWSTGTRLNEEFREEVYALNYNYRGIQLEIGMLSVQANLSNVYNRLIERFFIIIVSNAVKTFFVAIFILLMFQLLVTRHLYNIAQFSEIVDLSNGERNKLDLNRGAKFHNRNDALDRLVNAINGMCERITKSYHDIKKANAELEISKLEAIKANSTKSEFLAGMSHELRTPLNAIIGFSDIIRNQYFGPPGEGKYREYGNDIHKSAEHLLELVTGLLELSVIESGNRELQITTLRIHEDVNDCVRIFAPQALSKNIEIIVDGANLDAEALADRLSVRQILINILSNAIKYTKEGGKISIFVEKHELESQIIISDTGVGMTVSRLIEVNDPHTRISRDPYVTYEGWGLGLDITKSLIERNNGRLEIHSTPEIGTTVIVSLQLSLLSVDND